MRRPTGSAVPSSPTPAHVSAITVTSALGPGMRALTGALPTGRSGLQALDDRPLGRYPPPTGLPTWVGRVEGLDTPLPEPWRRWDCRNHRLAWQALQADGFAGAVRAAVERHGASRVALVLGTSTSSIGATEDAYRGLALGEPFPSGDAARRLYGLHALVHFVREVLGLGGVAQTVSTACTSSAKAFCTAERLLRLDLADAVVVGGADSLCGSVLFGFHALQLVSPEPCRPFDRRRQGINLGEAAGFALLERGPGRLQLLGWGESSDAHHMSAPHPQGLGAEQALDQALDQAGLDADAIDFAHLHGTATPQNDEVEAALLLRRFGAHTHAASTKGMTGHTLGAAGILGTAFCLHALQTGWMPGTAQTTEPDPAFGGRIALAPRQAQVRVAACHAFGFGGTNCVLLWGSGAPGGIR
jgi:3-oxoacyl-[acyl-carrier-protein] synthase I